ncbi:unnamed protein product [[Candida] boidinii]|uniref:Unnamed protein product n=1 Tax=Candida boidinii TaxID=5477 RepID=A0A9W6T0H3_CANBO|nr:unnamed protein product [[Candida] boidinii]
MFKKKLEVFFFNSQIKNLSNIKSSERRGLVDTSLPLFGFPKERISLETQYELFPKATKCTSYKTTTSSGYIYTDSECTPTWFESEESSIVPSLYTLWKCPYLLPIVLSHEGVIEILLQGYKYLNLPGTILPFDERCKKNTIVAIADYKDPLVPIAVGRCLMDLSVVKERGSGVAVQIYHFIDDELFKMVQKTIIKPRSENVSIESPLLPEEENEDLSNKEAGYQKNR